MKKSLQPILFLCMLMALSEILHAQGMKIGEVIVVSNSTLKKDADPAAFRNWVNNEIISTSKKKSPGTDMHLFQADRGNKKGEFLLVSNIKRIADRDEMPQGSPFAQQHGTKDPAVFLNNPESYTEYRLIGAEKFKTLPMVGILGIHYIKVKPERSAEFEKFVVEKLHPAVGQLFPDMQLLYYKAIAGDNKGVYITIFTIESVTARDRYWPAGAPETEILKKGFFPHKELAVELSKYLVEDSYLKPESGGAAAYLESMKWTDYVHTPSNAK